MDVVVLQVFVSLLLAAGSVLLFAHSMKQRDHEHSERLALLPLDADAGDPASAQSNGSVTPDTVGRVAGEDARDALGTETGRARGEQE